MCIRDRAKSEFLSRMSHEIRTPMNGIIGMVMLAQQNLDNQTKVVDCLRKISRSSRHLLNIINDVLDLSLIHIFKNGKREKPYIELRVPITKTINITLIATAREQFKVGSLDPNGDRCV